MDDLVTVIVPVYNVEKCLKRCVDSIISQTHPKLQIILINDGSTDGSGEICDDFAAQDSRVEVLHQVNAGVSAARNAGLSSARGVWIAFVDSDDYVSPYYIEDMLIAAVQNDCDIAICHAVWVREEDCGQTTFKRTTETRCATGREASLRRYTSSDDFYNSSWGKLSLACLWTDLRYPDGMIAEDMFVSHSLIYNAKKIAIINAKLYAYVQTDGSIMRGEFKPKRFDALDAWQEGVRVFDSAGDADLANIARRVYCFRTFDACVICKKELPQQKELLRTLKARAAEAYGEVKSIRGYYDCSPRKELAYRVMLFAGRSCLPLYELIFMRRSLWRYTI